MLWSLNKNVVDRGASMVNHKNAEEKNLLNAIFDQFVDC